MDDTKSPSESLESTGDTSRLLKELIDLQKSTASSVASIDRSINLQESHENLPTISGLVQNSGDNSAEPTMTEFMKTMYDGTRQLITLQGTDTANSFGVYGREVDIISSKQHIGSKSQSLSGSTGSNKVKITPVVNYDWEPRRYVGNLVAVHRNNVFMAYVLKGKSGGIVRVNNRKTAERHLLKDFVGRVIDLAFAHTDDVLLAVVDELGNLCVYEIKETEDRKIQSVLLLHVQQPKTSLVSEYHRVIWCPYIPDDADDSSATDSSSSDNASRVLVLTNDEMAEIWSVDMVTRAHGCGPLYPEDVDTGLIKINSHVKPIMDAAFSPDGTALATASIDGEIKFFQVYMNEKTSPRCLHQWKPHGGKPMSCLFFLDDHKNFSPDAQFWKFAVTGANNNQEIKIWNCESWNCLQTVRFRCPAGLPSNSIVEPCMKASIDLSAKFLVLSDIKRNVLYILQIHQDMNQNTAHISSVSEFTLAQSCLSFAILDAGTKRLKKSKGDDSHLDEITTGEVDGEEGEDEDKGKIEESTGSLGVQIKLYTVHPKALQELLIRFKPESSAPQPSPPSVSSISHSEGVVLDGLSDLSMNIEANGEMDKNDSFAATDTSTGQPVLLTPDAFTASPRKQYPDDSIIETVRGSMSSTSSFTQVSAMNDDFLSPRSSGGSTVTQTPTTPNATPKSPSTNNNNNSDSIVTPSSVPLPQETSMEETELATPTSAAQEEEEDEDENLDDTPPIIETAPQTVDDFFTQSKPIGKDLQQVSLDSTESTGLFEVTSSAAAAAGNRAHQKSQGSYDEMDEEVAEVMSDIHEAYTSDGPPPEGTQPFDEREEEGSQVNESTESSLRAWPKPPDVSKDSPRVTVQDAKHNEGEDQTEDVEDVEDEEDDVVVEEEEIEQAEEEEEEEREDDKEDEEEDIEEEIEEDIEEEQEESEESIENKREPMAAPVAGAGFNVQTRKERPVEVREIHKETIREVFDQKELQKLHTSMGSLLQVMERQQQQLDQLHRNFTQQQDSYLELQRRQLEQDQLREVPQGAQPSIEEHLGKLENIVTSRVERLFAQHSQKENQRMQDLMRQSESREEQKQARLQNTIGQTVNSSVSNNLERSVRQNVIPAVTKVLEPVREQIHQEMAQRLTATDSLLKDNIAKMVRSRQTVETLGAAAGNALQAPIQAAYREAFQNIVIPSFERTIQNMYQQVNDSFQRGTKDYTRQLESHMDSVRQKHLESRDPVVAELRKMTDSFQTSAEQMQSHVLATIQTQLSIELKNSMAGLQDKLVQMMRGTVREEVASAMQEQGHTISDNLISAMRSGAVTPAHPTPDPQIEKSHIMNLLRQGQINAAFQQVCSEEFYSIQKSSATDTNNSVPMREWVKQALSAANLELVIMLCEAVNPSQVFNQTPCPLQQPVLLSLIQQLSADLENHTELKHRYLEEAVMNLDIHDAVTQEHMRGVLYALNQKLKLYIPSHPNDKTTRSLRMLLMASESLVK